MHVVTEPSEESQIEPSGHDLHLVEPASEVVPCGQSAGTPAGSAQNLPASQMVHSVEPAVLQ